MTDRIRTYPYKVEYIELGDYYITPAGGKLPIFTQIVKAKNSEDAKKQIGTLSRVMPLTACRHPKGKGTVRPTRWGVLTPYQIEVVKAGMAGKKVTAKATGSLLANPATPPITPAPAPVAPFPIDRPMPSDLSPLVVGGYMVGYTSTAGTVAATAPPLPLVTPAADIIPAPVEVVETITFTPQPAPVLVSVIYPAPPVDGISTATMAPMQPPIYYGGVDLSPNSDLPPVLAIIPYVEEADRPLTDEEKMVGEVCENLIADGFSPADADHFIDGSRVDWPSWEDHTGLSPLAPDFFTAPDETLTEAEKDTAPETVPEVVTEIPASTTQYGMLDRDLPTYEGEEEDPTSNTKAAWICFGVFATVLAIGFVVFKLWHH